MSVGRDTLWPELTPSLITLTDTALPALPGVAGILSRANSALRSMKVHRDQILLVRPDRYVAAAFWPEDAARTVKGYRDKLGRV